MKTIPLTTGISTALFLPASLVIIQTPGCGGNGGGNHER